MPAMLHATNAAHANHPDLPETTRADAMDKIELVVTHQPDGPVGRHWSAIFGMAGGTVGRAGQNKLVLPDDDAMVARVHAMVRLDSDQAYIANLCERRSVQVDGLEVLSGQEVPLVPGAEIGIGPYRLRACLPGEQSRALAPATASASSALSDEGTQNPPATSNAQVLVPEVLASSLDLASLPNPWADIPPIEGRDPYASDLVRACLPAALSPSGTRVSPDANPFAMLGRVEDSHATLSPPDLPFPSGAGATSTADLVTGPSTVAPMLPNLFEGQRPATSGIPTPPAAHRAMVIPDDFDPFAADPKELASQQDPWSGDLVAKSLTEVAQLKHDDLLQALPRTGQFAGEMDNAAHTGLPQQLNPTIELNPLKLFREPGESMYVETEDHGMSRGSDLAQVFSMPRDVQHRATNNAPNAVPAATAPQSEAAPPAEQVIQAGLLAMQGLDLALFDGVSQGASTTAELWVKHPAQALERGPGAHGIGTVQPTPEGMAPHALDVLASPQSSSPFELARNHNILSGNSAAGLSTAPPQLHRGAVTASPNVPPTATPQATVPLQQMASSPIPLDTLAAAFLEGAAIEPGKINIAITPDFMRAFGEALRVAVQGSIDLLSARSEIKREFRADVTIIASGANNPLKFLPTADGVMLQLAGQMFPGFMKPVPAMKEAYNDLAVHQIALMAGIRAAYAEAVARLSPAELEKDAAAASGVLAKISSAHRKAALWDDFQQRYEAIRRNAEDDLMAFSGQTFVDAYEAAAHAAKGSL